MSLPKSLKKGVRLIGYGLCPSKRADEYQTGEFRAYNYGEERRIVKICKCGSWVTMTLEARDGSVFTKKHRASTQIPYFPIR